jgi:hypothetical protein
VESLAVPGAELTFRRSGAPHAADRSAMSRLQLLGLRVAVAGLVAMLISAAFGADLDCVYPPRGREHEAAAIARNGARAQREGNTLRLMAGAQPVELEDNLCETEPVSDCIRYSLVDYLADYRLFVVQLQYWEGDSYWLVDAYSGERLGLEGYPWLSPDRTHFVTVTGDEAGYVFNGFEIWHISRYGLERQWRHAHQPNRGSPLWFCLVRWIDERTVVLRAKTLVDEPGSAGTTLEAFSPATLLRTDRGWELRIGPP